MTNCLRDMDRLGLFDDYAYKYARILLSRSTIRSNMDERSLDHVELSWLLGCNNWTCAHDYMWSYYWTCVHVHKNATNWTCVYGYKWSNQWTCMHGHKGTTI